MPIPVACPPSTTNGSAMQHRDFSSSTCPHLTPSSTTTTTTTTNSNGNSAAPANINNNQINRNTTTNCSFFTDSGLDFFNRSTANGHQTASALPRALHHISELTAHMATNKFRPVIFLDYDGTLSPIVDDPDSATMPATIRAALSAIAARFPTAIVTGRSKLKIMDLVQLDNIIYAGSHGFDIHSPDGRISHRVASECIPLMRRSVEGLRLLSRRYPGTHVEDNVLSITIHYRHLVDRSRSEALKGDVADMAVRCGLARHDGKMVHELRPPHNWNKGRAVDYLLSELNMTAPHVVPIFIGDDISDESAFRTLRGRGISIIVADECVTRSTDAILRLRDPFEVGKFLMHLARHEGLSQEK